MRELYDSYFDYEFDCKEENLTSDNSTKYHDQIKAFNGGGSGG